MVTGIFILVTNYFFVINIDNHAFMNYITAYHEYRLVFIINYDTVRPQ